MFTIFLHTVESMIVLRVLNTNILRPIRFII